eukprot:PITA_12828
MKNGIWEIVPRPSDKSFVTSKCIYKIKHAIDGSIDKYKARFVARSFSQKEGIDYEETFAPTARYTTIRSLVSLVATMGWNIHQMDVKTKFLNGTIDEEVYIEQLEGVERKIQECKKMLATGFEMKDLELMRYYLGLEVCQRPEEIYLGQSKYIIKILQKFNMMDSKPMTTPMITNLKKLRSSNSNVVNPTSYHKLVGSLMYLVNTRPDICFPINVLSQFQLEPHQDHWIDAKHILRYLRGTIHHCLKYDGKEVKLIGYTNSDWGGSESDGRITTSGCFSLGSTMISWMSRKQGHVALSSAEAKYVVACEVGKEVVWLRKLLSDLFGKSLDPTIINCDNQRSYHNKL